MDVVKAERNIEEHFTRITLSDGTYEDFATIRGGIAFPFEKTPGVILIGRVCKESETVKILVEKEFISLSGVVSTYVDLEKQFMVHEFYYQDTLENEAFAEYLRKKTNWENMVWPAPHSEDFT